ncbi:hypothetical protein BDQ12DRAFT_676809 [Crucibulum laeve]|uniref:UBA domain-containing protein n=1 Tax=Crucibulum laeve TaxID=68775 RepID=A0A5C3MDF8_9AGAR|nr:hypothetical protein BDQ12DRAFT_676809 [Crucibulum laeve]
MSTNFTPTPAELAIVSQIFAQSDPQKLGVLTGDVAVRVFTGAKLPSTVLGEIWNIADEDNKGWLPKRGVAIAVRLIGHAQNGEKVTTALLNKPGPLPVIEGVSTVSQHNTGMSVPKSPPPGFPPLTPQDKAKFNNLFAKSGPSNGLLTGEKARDIFVKSKLPNDKLLQIWNLADTQDRGALDSVDFAIGMYFIQGLMSGQITFIPSNLPPGLYQQAGGSPAQGSIVSHMTGTGGSFSPMASTFSQRNQIQPQLTGQAQPLQPDYTGLSQSRAPTLPARPAAASGIGSSAFGGRPITNSSANQWDVTPTEKSNADRFFDDLDSQKRGYIEGDVAVPFMLESKLSGEVLAQIWDLSDINNDGRLTRDGFAVAVHLIQKKLAGGEIPAALPQSLVPPSMRNNGASPFSPISTQPQPEPARDLFSFDDTPPQSAVSPQPTGNFNSLQPQQTGPPIPSSSSFQPPVQDPFGTFSTGGSPHHDLLGDDDAPSTTSPPFQDRSAEIGNTKNQLDSTNRSLNTIKNERVNTEKAVADQASQLSALQTQLSSAKIAHETESNLLSALKDRHSNQAADIQRTREELIRAESDLSALRVEKAEIEGSFMRDKEEARDLHRRMVETGQQAEALKLEIEKVKKEAKQQKGLLAIARKQLLTKETERAKAEKLLAEANAEVAGINTEVHEVEAELANDHSSTAPPESPPERTLSTDSVSFAANHPLPTTPDSSSILSSPKSNNPFERLGLGSGNSTPRSQSPFLPFAGSSIPIPLAATNGHADAASQPSNDTADDIFGLDGTVGADVAPHDNATTSHDDLKVLTEPQAQHDPAALTAPTSSLTTPITGGDTDYFVTPPQTANGNSRTASPNAHNPAPVPYPSLDDAAAHFPAIENISPPAKPVPAQHNDDDVATDITSHLKELEVEDSDSDSDDEIPLAELAASSHKEAATPANVEQQPSQISFDDVFSVSTAEAPTMSNKPSGVDSAKNAVPTTQSPFAPIDVFGASSITSQPPATTVAGVNAFDEAMGKIPSPSNNSAPAFTFDSAFDDNFDFASASTQVENNTTQPLGFDDVFSTSKDDTVQSKSAVDFSAPVSTTEASLSSAKFGPSFEQAFASFDSEPSNNLASSLGTSTSAPPLPKRAESPVQKPFPATSVSSSPTASFASRTANSRSFSPPRAVSPPPRTSSPKPRVSSSKETHEKTKEPPARHSKLSLRLPFSKKKKTQEAIPPPSQHLTPPQEEYRTASPAVEDDVEAVKQLTDMGFSRSQAVSALEKYGYDVQRSLNSLLGQ